jgi:hypothetical protein
VSKGKWLTIAYDFLYHETKIVGVAPESFALDLNEFGTSLNIANFCKN